MNVISKLLTAASALAVLASPLAASAQGFHGGWGGPGSHEHWRGGWNTGWRGRPYPYPHRVYYGAPVFYGPPAEEPYYPPPAPVVYERPAPIYHRVVYDTVVVHRTAHVVHHTVRHVTHHAISCVNPHRVTPRG